jgi:hypothetical protein
MTNDDVRTEARNILDVLAFTPFENCRLVSREFANLPARPGLYAIRHCNAGLLYIGKTKNLRDRFRAGHKAFLWGWLDRYDPDDVRIAICILEHSTRLGVLFELETLILQATKPPYNAAIPREE